MFGSVSLLAGCGQFSASVEWKHGKQLLVSFFQVTKHDEVMIEIDSDKHALPSL